MNFKKFCFVIAFLILLTQSYARKTQSKSQDNKTNLLSSPAVARQDEMVPDEETPVEDSWQILEWESEDNYLVLKFRIEIQQYNARKNSYETIIEEDTESNASFLKINPALKVGRYRYRIAAYNLVGILDEYSDWCEFEIHRAYKPVVSSFDVDVNHSHTIYIEEINNGLITVHGRNLFLPEEQSDGIVFTRYTLNLIETRKRGRKKVRTAGISFNPEIIEHKDNNREITFRVDLENMEVGEYTIVATDASGLHSDISDSDSINVRYKKPVDFNISGGYMSPVVLFDGTLKEYVGSSTYPLSLMAKTTFIPVKRHIGYFGLGLELFGTYMNSDMKVYTVDGTLVSGYVDFVYQYPIFIRSKVNSTQRRHIMSLELHGGVGAEYFMNYVLHFPHNIDSKALNSLDLGFNVGAAVQIFITNRLYTEVNADFCFSRASDMNFGVVRPGAMIGWQF